MDPESTVKSFPPFRLDAGDQCLWRGDSRIPLTPKVFAVLEYLVRHAGRLVSQQELLEAVWPETYVQPEILRKYILEIRKALDDPAKKPRFIETLPKRGYRFIAAVHEEGSPYSATALGAPPAELVGRAGVLKELNACLREAARGHRQVVFITGEPGIGKTSLVDTFTQTEIAGAGVRVVRGQCVEGFGGKEAYYPILEGFGILLRRAVRKEVIPILAAQAPTWLIQFPWSIESGQREQLQRELLGATRERMVRELCDALELLSAEQPLLLIIEDLQWVDNPTLDLISAVARRRGPAKLLILGTYRPDDVTLSRSPLKLLKQELLVHRQCREIALSRLTETDVARYLESEFPSSRIAEELSGPIHRHSDGNPLFMLAILERLQQKGAIVREGADWALAASPAKLRLDIPETLQQMLEAQLEQLDHTEQQLLRAASVAGRRFTARAASALLETDADHLEEICDGLVARQQFLRRGGNHGALNGSAADYEFKHILYREVLYRQLKPARRRQLHLRLGQEMEGPRAAADPAVASELAFHFEEGQDYSKAVRYLNLSAANAMRRYAHGDAIQVLTHALELLLQVPAEIADDLEFELMEHVSDAWYAQGEMLRSAEVDRKAAELAARRELKAAQVHALTREARALAFLDPARCVAVCDRAADVSRTAGDPLLQARAELLAACWHIVTNGWTQTDADVCAAARDRLRRLSQELTAYYEILYAHVQCIQGDYAEGYRTALAGIPRALENGNLVVYLSAHSSLSHALLHLGRWGELLEVLASATDVAQKNRNAPWVGIYQAYRAWLHFHACDFEAAHRMAGDLLQTHTEEPPGQVRSMAMITKAFAEIELGFPDVAIAALTQICERQQQPRFFMDWYWRTIARLGLAEAWLAKNDRERAGREAEQFLESAMSGADPTLQAQGWEMKARLLLHQPDAARKSLDRALAALATGSAPSTAWRVHATASRLHEFSGAPIDAARHREHAGAILQKLAESLPKESPLRASVIAMAKGQLPA